MNSKYFVALGLLAALFTAQAASATCVVLHQLTGRADVPFTFAGAYEPLFDVKLICDDHGGSVDDFPGQRGDVSFDPFNVNVANLNWSEESKQEILDDQALCYQKFGHWTELDNGQGHACLDQSGSPL
jgi:hypothetical protein